MKRFVNELPCHLFTNKTIVKYAFTSHLLLILDIKKTSEPNLRNRIPGVERCLPGNLWHIFVVSQFVGVVVGFRRNWVSYKNLRARSGFCVFISVPTNIITIASWYHVTYNVHTIWLHPPRWATYIIIRTYSYLVDFTATKLRKLLEKRLVKVQV
jgi:hypothetical protein